MIFFIKQESVKTKHPQLLYESKVYRILQGGGAEGEHTVLNLPTLQCYHKGWLLY